MTRESEAAKADFFEGRRVDNKRALSQRVRDEKVDCEGFLFGPKCEMEDGYQFEIEQKGYEKGK